MWTESYLCKYDTKVSNNKIGEKVHQKKKKNNNQNSD